MLRVVLILLFLLIVWVLFFSKLSALPRRIIAVVILIVFIAAVWFDDHRKRPKVGLIKTAEVVSCGISTTSVYRSTYDLQLCFANTAPQGTVKRLRFAVLANECSSGSCDLIQRVEREMPFVIEAGSQTSLLESLRFDNITDTNTAIQWSAEVLEVKAIP